MEDFLTSRLLEILVHSDDLAVSIGAPAPVWDTAVSESVVVLLARLSLRRHGSTALLRALSRGERASGDVSAFS